MNAARLTATRMMGPASVAVVAGGFALYTVTNPPPVYARQARYSDSAAAASKMSTPIDLDQVRGAISEIIKQDKAQRGDGSSLTGTFIRLAWSCAATYNAADGTGGSSGARIRFKPEVDWAANAGLSRAREALEPVKKKFPMLSYADLYTFAGVAAVEGAGGPEIPFRAGRVDAKSGEIPESKSAETSPPESRLPNVDRGSRDAALQHLRDVSYRMGFNDQEIVALFGAHTMGRCHKDRTGYYCPLTNDENTFCNEYFVKLLNERWTLKKSHNGKPWNGPVQYEDSSGKLIMLPADISLLSDPEFKKWVEVYAKDQDRFFRDFAKAFAKLLELGVDLTATHTVSSYQHF